MGMADLLLLLQTWGPAIGPALVLLAFFLWKDYRREDRLQGRIEKLEQEHRDVVLPMVEKCAQVIASNTEVMKRVLIVLTQRARADSHEARCVLDKLLADAEEHRESA